MGYAEERVQLAIRLRKERPAFADALALDGRLLRFHLGTSLADLRVPVLLGPELREALRAAVRDLFFILSVRHRAALRENEYDRLLLLDGFDPRAVRAASFGVPAQIKSEHVRRAFLEAPELHPALDSGLIATWLGTGRPGRTYAGALNAVLRRAREEAVSGERKEPTPFLVMLALRSLMREALALLRDVPVLGPAGRVMHGAVATGMLIATRLAMHEAGLADPQSEAANSVLPWIGGLRGLWGNGGHHHGIPFNESPPRFDEHVRKLAKGGTPEAIARDAHAELNTSREGAAKAARPAALAKLRGELLQLLRWNESGRAQIFSVESYTLPQLFSAPLLLERVLANASLRKELHARAKAQVKTASHDAARAVFESIALAAREWKDDDPRAYISTEQVVKSWTSAVAALAADAAVDQALEAPEAKLLHRSGTENESGLEAEHAAGKLYLFAPGQPILLARVGAPQMGHLFCDMKDFTKRTAFLKETVVADFLAREFYNPILSAAGRHQKGASHLADKGGIYLNNLLGDAVSFSGDIDGLVELADEIRHALASYARRLEGESSRESVARTVAQVEARFRARQEQLAMQVAAAKEAARTGALDPISGDDPAHRLRALTSMQQKLEEEREAEIALASGEKLEAGIFISFGAAPEVATFEDPVFGSIKVSIAEKINESARGTARSGGVRARIDALLDAERKKRGEPGLTCPLLVSVAQPLSMPLPPDIEEAVRVSVRQKDLESAETVIGAVARDFVAALASKDLYEDRGDIYNGGAALSEEALRAWMAARAGELVFVERSMPVAELHQSLRAQFVFPMSSLQLVAAVNDTHALQALFVYVGRALFKGFEKQGGLAVYEMIPREGRFAALFAQHHLDKLLHERKREPVPAEDPFHSFAPGGT